jgi:hypothetical protein
MVLLIVSLTVWNSPGSIPRTLQTFSTGTTQVSVPLTSVVDLVVQGDGTNMQNIFFSAWNGNNVGNCISVEQISVKGPANNPIVKDDFSYNLQTFATPYLQPTTDTFVTFRIRFCTPVTTFDYAFND